MDGPGTVKSYSSVRVYSDIGEYMSGNPCTTLDCQSNSGLQSGGQIRHGITGQEWQFRLSRALQVCARNTIDMKKH